MKLKALREKRNLLVNQLEEKMAQVEVENRSLNEEELADFARIKSELEANDKTIAAIEETRALVADKVSEVVEVEAISVESAEIRALDKFARGAELTVEERRILTSTAANQALIPVNIHKAIFKRLEELVPVLAHATRFSSKGTLRLINETTYGDAEIAAENTEFADQDPIFGKIELTSYKIATQVSITFEMLANSEIELGAYLLDVLVRRLSKALNRFFLVGTGEGQPEGLVNGTQVVTFTAGTAVALEDFIAMQSTMMAEYLDGAAWLVSRSCFQALVGLVDGMGRPFMTHDVIGEKLQYKLLGLPVYVDQHMDVVEAGKKPVILANIKEAYAVNMLKDIQIRHLTEIGYTSGYEVFAGFCMADGKIKNQDAVVVGEMGAASL